MFMLVLFLSWAHAAETKAWPKNIACFDKVSAGIQAAGTPEQWLQIHRGVGARLTNYGHAEIYAEDTQTRLVMVNDKTTTFFLFKAPACKGELSRPVPHRNAFMDFDLAELYQRNPSGGLIYVWSPHMELSISELDNLPKLGLEHPFTVVMDPEADEALAEKIVTKKKWPREYLRRVASIELAKADVGIHYPSTAFYKNGKIVKRIPGYNGKSLPKLTEELLK